MKNNKSNHTQTTIYPQGIHICPICNKEFVANDDTRYIIGGGYTCSWKCFLNRIREQEANKANNTKTTNSKK